MWKMEIHKGQLELNNDAVLLPKMFSDWVIKNHCSCLVAYYNMSKDRIAELFKQWTIELHTGMA
jgi:hypothetical protein